MKLGYGLLIPLFYPLYRACIMEQYQQLCYTKNAKNNVEKSISSNLQLGTTEFYVRNREYKIYSHSKYYYMTFCAVKPFSTDGE